MTEESVLYHDIGENVKIQRINKGMTQQEMADQLHLKRASVIKYEKGTQKIPIHYIYAICAILGLPLTALLPLPENIHNINTNQGKIEVNTNLKNLINTQMNKL